VKRQEFKDLTKKQNRLALQTLPIDYPVATMSKPTTLKKKKFSHSSSVTKAKMVQQDRQLFQKTMAAIQSKSNIRRMKQEISIVKRVGKFGSS